MPFKPVCATCGKPNDNREVANHCKACHAVSKAVQKVAYQDRKASGKAKTPQTPEANRESQAMRYEGSNEYYRDRMRRIRQERKEKGLCAYCGNNPPYQGLTICEPCRDYQRARYYELKKDPHHQRIRRADYNARQDRRKRLFEEEGLCRRCSSRPAREGGTQCEQCHEFVANYNKEYNERMKAKYGLSSITQVRKMRKEEQCAKREKIESFKDRVLQRSRSAYASGFTTSK